MPKLFKLIFVFAILLRCLLAFFNREANDNHIDVVSYIVERGRLPEKIDCWSCYQPKLYYIIASGFIKFFDIEYYSNRIITMQFINVFFSVFILYFIFLFINKFALTPKSKLIIFGLIAFNPCLTGINIQSTNDSLIILCGIASLYFMDRFFKIESIKDFTGMTVFVIFGALVKGTGILLFVLLVSLFFLQIIFKALGKASVKKLFRFFLIYLSLFILVVPFFGGYYNNLKKYNSLTLSTWDKSTPPLFFTTTPIGRPGVNNVFDSFFTFKYFDLIKHPCITNGAKDYPNHRTSVWSQLYGRTLFMHFDQWPTSWQTRNAFILKIGSIILLIGIIPLLILITGILKNAYSVCYSIIKGDFEVVASNNTYLHLFICVGFLAASVKYSYDYRDFSAMKSIYIMPGIISFLYLFMLGYSLLKNRLIKIINIFLIILIVLSICDIVFLISQLYNQLY